MFVTPNTYAGPPWDLHTTGNGKARLKTFFCNTKKVLNYGHLRETGKSLEYVLTRPYLRTSSAISEPGSI